MSTGEMQKDLEAHERTKDSHEFAINMAKSGVTKRIVTIINTKIEEHKIEIAGSDKAMVELQMSLKSKTERPDFNKVKQLGILKDKIIFHKACAAVLQDLKEDINNDRRE